MTLVDLINHFKMILKNVTLGTIDKKDKFI